MLVDCLGVIVVLWVQERWPIVMRYHQRAILHAPAESFLICVKIVPQVSGAEEASGGVVTEAPLRLLYTCLELGYVLNEGDVPQTILAQCTTVIGTTLISSLFELACV
jgi:hypothetical protein